MILDELFERAVLLTKTVWRKQGDEISRQEIKRMVATAQPRTYVEVGDAG
jgi:hypothetical protein